MDRQLLCRRPLHHSMFEQWVCNRRKQGERQHIGERMAQCCKRLRTVDKGNPGTERQQHG